MVEREQHQSDTLRAHRIGFIGLGLMGRPMCLHLHAAGAQLAVWNRTAGVAEELATTRLRVCASPTEVAQRSELVIVTVADTSAVQQVLFGDRGLAYGLRSDSLVIDMGTTAVEATREFATRLAEQGVAYVDAPVSGGEIGARDATLTIMAGGNEAALTRARPVLQTLGTRVTHVGDVGAGQVAKAANQVIVGLNIGAVAEALALVRAAGVDPQRVRTALRGGFADSRVLEVHGQRMIDATFAPGARVTTQHKDLRQAIELAGLYDQPMPATELSESLYRQLIERGDGDLDHSALIRLLEAGETRGER